MNNRHIYDLLLTELKTYEGQINNAVTRAQMESSINEVIQSKYSSFIKDYRILVDFQNNKLTFILGTKQ